MAKKARPAKATKPANKKSEAKSSAKIVWAMDPFTDLSVDPTSLGQFLYFLGRSHRTSVQPIYVLAPEAVNWTGDFSGHWFKKYAPLAETAAGRVVGDLHTTNVLKAKILESPKKSLREDIKRLLAEVKKLKADLLVVQSHGRAGVPRAVLGSFAETLLLQSQVPVMVLNGAIRPPSHVKTVLFPTDMSKDSKKALFEVLAQIREWSAQLIIYHKLPDPIEPLVQSGVYMTGGWMAVDDYLKREKSERQVDLDKWVAEVKKHHAEVRVILDDRPGLMSDAILRAATTEKADLVALSTQVGPVGAVLLGSVARQLAREAQVPVLVFRHGKSSSR